MIGSTRSKNRCLQFDRLEARTSLSSVGVSGVIVKPDSFVGPTPVNTTYPGIYTLSPPYTSYPYVPCYGGIAVPIAITSPC
jgi:hypothetical protein